MIEDTLIRDQIWGKKYWDQTVPSQSGHFLAFNASMVWLASEQRTSYFSEAASVCCKSSLIVMDIVVHEHATHAHAQNERRERLIAVGHCNDQPPLPNVYTESLDAVGRLLVAHGDSPGEATKDLVTPNVPNGRPRNVYRVPKNASFRYYSVQTN